MAVPMHCHGLKATTTTKEWSGGLWEVVCSSSDAATTHNDTAIRERLPMSSSNSSKCVRFNGSHQPSKKRCSGTTASNICKIQAQLSAYRSILPSFPSLPTNQLSSAQYRGSRLWRISSLLTTITLLTLGCLPVCHGFQMDGTQSSFAQFRKWYTGLNGTLEFEFKTEQPNGLVLYTDDGGTFDFFEVKLVEGAVRLRYNLGGGANIITVGRELHDGHWHKVQVSVYLKYVCNSNRLQL